MFQIGLMLGNKVFFSEKKMHINQEVLPKSNYELKSRRNSINRFNLEIN